MLLVGLTGGIASGKTTGGELFGSLVAAVLDAYVIAGELDR